MAQHTLPQCVQVDAFNTFKPLASFSPGRGSASLHKASCTAVRLGMVHNHTFCPGVSLRPRARVPSFARSSVWSYPSAHAWCTVSRGCCCRQAMCITCAGACLQNRLPVAGAAHPLGLSAGVVDAVVGRHHVSPLFSFQPFTYVVHDWGFIEPC